MLCGEAVHHFQQFHNLGEHRLLKVLIKAVTAVAGRKGARFPEDAGKDTAAQRTIGHYTHALLRRPADQRLIIPVNHRILRLIGLDGTVLSCLLHLGLREVRYAYMEDLALFFHLGQLTHCLFKGRVGVRPMD